MAKRDFSVAWRDVKLQIQEALLARGLANPSIRLNALESLERLLRSRYPDVLQNPNIILDHSKPDVTAALARLKANGKLNSAEKSVLNNVYQIASGRGMTLSRRERLEQREVTFRTTPAAGRADSDEHYVIDLCDRVLGRTALRQHRFTFLRGDAGPRRQGVQLPVDAYYPELELVVEYRERQHTEEVTFFDKPERLTVSGVHRGEQRRLYDARRREVLTERGIHLLELSFSDFAHDAKKQLRRHESHDVAFIQHALAQWTITPGTG